MRNDNRIYKKASGAVADQSRLSLQLSWPGEQFLDVLGGRSISPVLTMRLADLRCALPLSHVLETMRPLPVQPLACTPAFVLGLSVIRGEAVPVVDLASLLETSSVSPSRFVLVRSGDRRVALAVEQVTGIHEFAGRTLSSLPPLVSGVRSVHVEAIGSLDRELLLVLDSARLIPDQVWASLPKGEVR